MVRTPSTMLPLGTEAEDFSLINIDGRTLSFADVAGKHGTVLMFICNHCPFVKHVADELAAIGHEYMPKGIGMVAINSNDVAAHPADSPEQMVHESEQRGYPFPYLFDETQDVAKLYHAACTPDFSVFNTSCAILFLENWRSFIALSTFFPRIIDATRLSFCELTFKFFVIDPNREEETEK